MATKSPTPKIAALILTLNQRDTTLRVLESFGADERRRVRFLVWDNGSNDGTADAIRERYPEVHVHWNPVNLGVASGRNGAAKLAMELFDPEFLAFVDNDLVVTDGYLDALLQPMLDDPRVGQTQAKLRLLAQPHLVNDGGGCQVSFWRGLTRPIGMGEVDRGQYDEPRPCISGGGAMMVRAALFRELDGFDPIFDPVGPEDLDFSLRLQKAGHVALYTPAAMAYHEVGHTYSAGSYSQDYARIKARNWLKFMTRHATTVEKLGFYALGVPLITGRLFLREAARGNFGAITGSLAGIFEAARRSRSTPKGNTQ